MRNDLGGRVVTFLRKMYKARVSNYLLLLLVFCSTCHTSHQSEKPRNVHGAIAIGAWKQRLAIQSLFLRGGAGSLASMFTADGELIYDPTRCGALTASLPRVFDS